MTPALETLLEIADPPLGRSSSRLPGVVVRRFGRPAEQLAALLAHTNGFLMFENALHMLPVGPVAAGYDLTRWNSDELWRAAYSESAKECLFFAEDIFGEQFCIYDERVWRFNPETGEREDIAADLEEWAQTILDDFVTETGFPLARAWQERRGPLLVGQRLVPIMPFVLGGHLNLENLRALDAAEGMRIRAEVARQIRDLPNGALIRFILHE